MHYNLTLHATVLSIDRIDIQAQLHQLRPMCISFYRLQSQLRDEAGPAARGDSEENAAGVHVVLRMRVLYQFAMI
uniref:Uncharacterized protein n=1 Tax=Arundo donax TaxID=35708 RepID=A0A0A9FKL0_ARUDO